MSHPDAPPDHATPRDLIAINCALARAVGLTSTDLVSFTLTVQPGHLPRVDAQYRVAIADGADCVRSVRHVVAGFDLAPRPVATPATPTR